jgi:hypothetical protein
MRRLCGRAGQGMKPAQVLARDGETYLVTHDGASVRLRPSKGLQLLELLVAEPGREQHVIDLVGRVEGGGPVDAGDAGELFDDDAKRAYRRRVEDLRDAIEEADRFGDAGRAGQARAELEAIEDELARGLGLGGRARRGGSAVERARINVQRRVRDAIARVAAEHAELGRWLERAVKTGTYCVFNP